jgi:hypothetical protein
VSHFAGFDRVRCDAHGFTFPPAGGAPAGALRVELPVMGPRLLLSAASTATQPTLRWCVRVEGNTAVEFACLPEDETLLDDANALHHRNENAAGATAVGFHSERTAGSRLSHSLPVVKGSCVELLARRGLLRVTVTPPPPSEEQDATETPTCVHACACSFVRAC